MVKTTVVLGMMISLIGGIAPRLIRADGKIDVSVKGKANIVLGLGEAKAKPKPKVKSVEVSKKFAKKSTKVKIEKGEKTMKTISSNNVGVGRASSFPGE